MSTDTNRTGRWALKEVAAVAAVSVALWASPSAWSLGLGRLSVQSAIGESLRAEIDVTSLTPEEAANLRVRVATPDAYRVAGIDYNPVLPSTSIALQRRADGTPFLQITSGSNVGEPFVDLILELSWSSGRLLREYTLLFDPPNSKMAAAAPATQMPPVAGSASAAAPAPAKAPAVAAPAATPAPTPAAPRTAASAPVKAKPAAAPASAVAVKPEKAPAAAPAPAAKAPAAQEDYKVRSGDTLTKIARNLGPRGVSLDQLIVSLYRGNPQAFIGNNMNRLRSGVVMNLGAADDAPSIEPDSAHQLIIAQSADFDAYRRRLAGAVADSAEPAAPARQASGKVQSEVQDKKQSAAATTDRLTLDKGKAASSALEEKVAKERADKEAAVRMRELNRNVEELKKLQAASAAATTTASAPAAAPTPAPTPAPVAAAPASVPERGGLVAAPTPAPTVASAPMIAAASAPKVAEPAPMQPPPPMPGGEEPSLIDTLSENPLVLPGAGLILAILAGLGWYRLRNKNKEEGGVTSFLESRLQPDSFFGASGGQRIDTRDAGGSPSSMSYSLSQIDAIGDVDPVAEADVYLAYGRDLQAEEILKEAMRANPDRLAIRTKLLEVYAKRRDIKGFELLAGELYGLTGGQGEEWVKAQDLGRSIDPENPMYEPGGMPQSGGSSGGSVEPLGASTMPQSVVPSPSRFEHSVPGTLDLGSGVPDGADSGSVDLDISGVGAVDNPPSVPPSSGFGTHSDFGKRSSEFGSQSDFGRRSDFGTNSDFGRRSDFGARQSGFGTQGPTSGFGSQKSDFGSNTSDFGGKFVSSRPAPVDDDAHSVDFSLQQDFLASKPPGGMPPPSQPMDMGNGLSLDLDVPLSGEEPTTGPGTASTPFDLSGDDDADPLARKIELAEEFRQIGDLEGARDLLQEVIEKADGALKSRAQSMLDNLS